jgi:hypothetical protein
MIDEDRSNWTLGQLADEVIEACELPMGCRATIIAALGDAKEQGRALGGSYAEKCRAIATKAADDMDDTANDMSILTVEEIVQRLREGAQEARAALSIPSAKHQNGCDYAQGAPCICDVGPEKKSLDGVLTERESLRAAQARRVMPLIGPLLDAWEGTVNDERSEPLEAHLAAINAAMGAEDEAVPSQGNSGWSCEYCAAYNQPGFDTCTCGRPRAVHVESSQEKP